MLDVSCSLNILFYCTPIVLFSNKSYSLSIALSLISLWALKKKKNWKLSFVPVSNWAVLPWELIQPHNASWHCFFHLTVVQPVANNACTHFSYGNSPILKVKCGEQRSGHRLRASVWPCIVLMWNRTSKVFFALSFPQDLDLGMWVCGFGSLFSVACCFLNNFPFLQGSTKPKDDFFPPLII